LSSQNWVTELSKRNRWQTKLIAASLRNYSQLEMLAGTDVYTMPPKVAAAGHENLSGKFVSRLGTHYDVPLNSAAEGVRVEKFWEVSPSVVQLGTLLNEKVPVTGDELVERVYDAGLGDMFPRLSSDDKNRIQAEGKIPVLASWRERILDGELAPDTLLTLAGLASFTADQKQLDDRITGIIAPAAS